MHRQNDAPPGIILSPYQQVMNAISSRFPHLSKSQINTALITLRRLHGDLRGFTVSSLIEQLSERFSGSSSSTTMSQGEYQAAPVPIDSGAPPPSDAGLCVICRCPMIPEMDGLDLLDCGHQYHSECIRPWIAQNKTCPQCRSYSLLEDEYPTLN